MSSCMFMILILMCLLALTGPAGLACVANQAWLGI